MAAELGVVRQIWENSCVVEVGPDPNGSNCVEIRLKEGDKILVRMTQTIDSARFIAQAIFDCAAELERNKKNDKC